MSKKNATRANNARQMRASNGRFCKASEVSTTAEPSRDAEFSQKELDETYKAMNKAIEQPVTTGMACGNDKEPLSDYFIDDPMTRNEKIGCMVTAALVFFAFLGIVALIVKIFKDYVFTF